MCSPKVIVCLPPFGDNTCAKNLTRETFLCHGHISANIGATKTIRLDKMMPKKWSNRGFWGWIVHRDNYGHPFLQNSVQPVISKLFSHSRTRSTNLCTDSHRCIFHRNSVRGCVSGGCDRCPVPHSSCGTIHQNNLKQSRTLQDCITGAPFHTLVVGQFTKQSRTIFRLFSGCWTILNTPGLYYRCPVPHSSCGTIHQNNLKQSLGCSQAVEQSSTIHDCFLRLLLGLLQCSNNIKTIFDCL